MTTMCHKMFHLASTSGISSEDRPCWKPEGPQPLLCVSLGVRFGLVCLGNARQQKFSLIIVLPLVLPLFSSQAVTVVQIKRSLMARILLEHIVLVRFPRSSGSPATPWSQSKILPGNILTILFTPSQLACLDFRQQTILTFVNLINKNDMTEKLGK